MNSYVSPTLGSGRTFRAFLVVPFLAVGMASCADASGSASDELAFTGEEGVGALVEGASCVGADVCTGPAQALASCFSAAREGSYTHSAYQAFNVPRTGLYSFVRLGLLRPFTHNTGTFHLEIRDLSGGVAVDAAPVVASVDLPGASIPQAHTAHTIEFPAPFSLTAASGPTNRYALVATVPSGRLTLALDCASARSALPDGLAGSRKGLANGSGYTTPAWVRANRPFSFALGLCTGDGCRRPAGSACATTVECQAGLTCQGNTCLVPIGGACSGATCVAGAACVSGSCFSVPGAPTAVVAASRRDGASVTFTPPASDGGSPILSYSVTAAPGGLVTTGPDSPIRVLGLTPGTPYTFTILATNVAGNSLISGTSNAVTPSGPAVLAQSTFVPSVSSVAANGSSSVTLTLTLKDAAGRAVQGEAVTLGKQEGTTFTPAAGFTNASGVFTATAKSGNPGRRRFGVSTYKLGFGATVRFTPVACAGLPSFVSLGEVEGQSAARGVAYADFNGDGKVDAATANTNGSVSLARGAGAGTFLAPTHASVTPAPTELLPGDLDNNGRADAIGWNPGQSGLSVLLGNTSGGFTQGTALSAPAAVAGATLGDLDGDGTLDVAAAIGGGLGAAVWFGNGDGTFGTPATHAAGGAGTSVAIADVVVDGKEDLVIGHASGLSILPASGGGGFGARLDVATSHAVEAIAAGDLDLDGNTDLFVLRQRTASATLLKGTGTGSFTTATLPVGLPADLVGAAIRDQDADGWPELFVRHASGVAVAPNPGGIALGTMVNSAVSANTGGLGLALADLNGDGRPDLGVPLPYTTGIAPDGGLNILLARADRTYVASRGTVDLPGGQLSTNFADFNADGHTDFLTTNSGDSSQNGSIVIGDGTGNFSVLTNVPIGGNPCGAVVSDFDHDGQPDFASCAYVGQYVKVVTRNGSGGFVDRGNLTATPYPYDLAGADLDGDTHFDLVATQYFSGSTFSVWRGVGDGTFNARSSYSTLSQPYSLDLGDFDGDGKADVAIAGYSANQVVIHPGLAGAAFGAIATTLSVTGAACVDTADFNGDGKLDLVASLVGPQQLKVFLGNGDRTFQSPSTYAVGNDPWTVVAEDLNGDGKADLAAAAQSAATIHLRANDGAGGFGPMLTLPTGLSPTGLGVADLNDDGRNDIVVPNYSEFSASLFIAGGCAP